MKAIVKMAAVLIVLIIMLSGCGEFSIMSSEINKNDAMKKQYLNSNENESRNIYVAEGETCIVTFDIVSNSGTINLSIEKGGDNSYYNGTDVPTSQFDATLDEPGEYTLNIHTDNHSGSFDISWERQTGVSA